MGGPGAIPQYPSGQRLLLGPLVCGGGSRQAAAGTRWHLLGAGQLTGELLVQPERADADRACQPSNLFPGGLFPPEELVFRLCGPAAGAGGGRDPEQPLAL